MCPCSCTQNIPERLHKKRDADLNDVPTETVLENEPSETKTTGAGETIVTAAATNNDETKTNNETTETKQATEAVTKTE